MFMRKFFTIGILICPYIEIRSPFLFSTNHIGGIRMRRLFALALLMLLVIVPTAAFAQDATPEATDQAIWNLSQKFTVTDLGFQFNYPEGWVTDSSAGIKLAENQDDLNTLLDTDDTTNPKGYAIFLSGASVTTLGLKADAKLDDVVHALV